jgi:hypothetical protein
MGNKSKILGPSLVFLSLLSIALTPLSAAAQVSGYYSNNAEINPVAFTLTVNNPENQSTYSKSLPLQVDLIWNISLDSLLTDHMPVKGYAYAIDDNQLVNMEPNGSLGVPRKESYYFNYSVDISGLSQGNHELSVIVWQYYNNSNYQGLYNQSSTPIAFKVDNTLPATPTPTPPIPELSWLIIVPLLLILFCAAIAAKRRYFQ